MRKYCGTPRETIPFRIMDFFVDIYAKLFYKNRKAAPATALPKRMLIASLGHLGDALTVTYLFPLIKNQYPDISIDLLIPSWCKDISRNNPYIARTIYIDHYQTNRRKISRWQKIKEHYSTFMAALPLLKQHPYDYYFDIRYSDAVAHFVLPFISVGRAYGFARRGLGGLLTKEFDVPEGEFHHFDMYYMLLREMGLEGTLSDVKPYFPISSESTLEAISRKIPLPSTPYLLLFPESGGEHKLVSIDFWASLLGQVLHETNYHIFLCGQTSISKQIIDSMSNTPPNRLTNTAGTISIHEIALLSQHADFALTLDSFPAHLCCLFCKTIAVYKGTGYPFFPLASYPTYLLHNHQPSVGLPFDRPEVEIAYIENLESDLTKELIINRLKTLNIHE